MEEILESFNEEGARCLSDINKGFLHKHANFETYNIHVCIYIGFFQKEENENRFEPTEERF